MRYLPFLLYLTLTVTSCKKESDSGKFCFTTSGTELKIENKAGREFYFIIIEKTSQVFIDWGRVCEDNNLPPNSVKVVELSPYRSYSDSDSIIVHWWECGENTPQDGKSIVLGKNQSSCP